MAKSSGKIKAGKITPKKSKNAHKAKNEPKRDAPVISKETQEAMKQAKALQAHKSGVPKWLIIKYETDKKGKIILDKATNQPIEKYRYADPAKLGEAILNKHAGKWLLVQDEDKKEFWTYRPLIHDYKGDDLLNKLAKKQDVWQMDDIKSIRGSIHQALAKYHVWRAKSESDTYKYITGALEAKVKPKDQTVGHIDADHILAADGVLDINTKQIVPNDPSYYFTDFMDYQIKNASPNGNGCKHILAWFKDTFQDEAIALEQYIGYMLLTDYKKMQGFVILLNTGGEGKTTIINFIKSLLPQSEESGVSLQQLTQSEELSKNFSISELYKKRLNSADDITKDFIQDGSKIKIITGGGSLNAPRKGKSDLNFIPYAKELFACNELPGFKDDSNGWARRPYIIRAHAINFAKKYSMKQIYKERGSFILYCLKAFQDRYNEQIQNNVIKPRLTETQQMKNDLGNWLYDNDPIQQFISERVVPKKDLPDQGKHTVKNCRPAQETYNAYVDWTQKARVEPIGRNKFYNALRRKGYIIKSTTVESKHTTWIMDFRFIDDKGHLPNEGKAGSSNNKLIDMPHKS